MAYLENDVHDLDSAEVGNLVITTLADRDVVMLDVRLTGQRRRRTMRIWYDNDPIDQDELEDRL